MRQGEELQEALIGQRIETITVLFLVLGGKIGS